MHLVSRYGKTLVAGFGAVVMAALTALLDATRDQRIDSSEWILVVVAGWSVLSVWATANLPTWPHLKTSAAAVGVVLNLLVAFVVGGVDTTEWLLLGLHFLTALGVSVAPAVSGPPSPPPAPPRQQSRLVQYP